MTLGKYQTVAVIGAGIAGAACATALVSAGHSVHVFDKSRGPGGRLATRRVGWIDGQGLEHTARFDHGAIGISARTDAFKIFVDRCVGENRLTKWMPQLAIDSVPLENDEPVYLPPSDMPSLCRDLLQGAALTLNLAVDRLIRNPLGWQLEATGECHPLNFDAVVLALPPAQAAALLSPHRGDWAQQASAIEMQPCWTLMGITENAESGLTWELARPSSGPLAWIIRNDARPGREHSPGFAQWVVHANADWSRQHLEQPAAWIEQQLQAALGEWLGRTLRWQHSATHRWRYALPPPASAAASEPFWWDATQSLGICGDFFGGVGIDAMQGVERAWLSAQSLYAEMLQHTDNAFGRTHASAIK